MGVQFGFKGGGESRYLPESPRREVQNWQRIPGLLNLFRRPGGLEAWLAFRCVAPERTQGERRVSDEGW